MEEHDHGGAEVNRRRLLIAFSVSATILLVEIIGAAVTGSLALIVDAGHLLTDVGGLAIALLAANLMLRPASDRRTWGYARAEVIAASAQAAVLFAVGLFVLVEGIRRLLSPLDVPSGSLLIFGIIGLVGNMVSISVLAGGRSASFNLRAAFLEVVNDALGSAGVIVAAIAIALTSWQRADSVAGLIIGVLIMPRAVKLLRETIGVLMESTPPGLDLEDVRQHLLGVDHVHEVHDLHASQISSGLPVLTAHITLDAQCFTDGHTPVILDQLQACVAEHFAVTIEHSTFQLEPSTHQEHEHGHHS